MANVRSTMAASGSGIPGVTVTHGIAPGVIEIQGGKISGGPQLETDDILLAIGPRVFARFEGFKDESSASFRQYDVDEDRTQELRRDLADQQFTLAQAKKLPNNSTAVGHAEKAVAKAQAKLDAHQEKRKARPGTHGNSVLTFVNSRADFLNFQWQEAVVPDPAGDDAKAHDDLRADRAKLLNERTVIEKAPVTQDRIEARAREQVRAWRDGDSINAKPITRMVKGDGGRLHQGNVTLPMLPTIVGANGFMTEIPNVLSILAEVIGPQLEKHLIAKAMVDYDPDEALQDSERRDQIAAIDAQIDIVERQGEILFCKLRDKGVVAQRWCVRPEVLLGITKV